jgi:hypothetical protein
MEENNQLITMEKEPNKFPQTNSSQDTEVYPSKNKNKKYLKEKANREKASLNPILPVNVVKLEIWKASLRETRSCKSHYRVQIKKLLLYYRFGSSTKNKKKNYLTQLGDWMI